MSVGEVVFNASDGYDEDMWDDSLLIRNYEKALDASRRELMRRRKEGGKNKKNWNFGDYCRVLHSLDGLEYEGTIVKLSARKATVRLHGYYDELEVPVLELERSLGQHHIQNQIEQAKLEGFEEEEESYTGELSVGSYCRARWSLDDVVYEGIIESVDSKKKQVRVKFVGYLNEDTVDMTNVYKSKGEEWREQQIEDSKCDINGDLSETLNTFMDQNPEVFSQIPALESLSLEEPRDKTSAKGKSKHRKEKSKSKMEKMLKKENVPIENTLNLQENNKSSEFPSLPNLSMNFELPNPCDSPAHFLGTPGLPRIGELPRLGPLPPLPCAPPYPSVSDATTANQHKEVLESMLLSWYMAGYHTGYFQAVSNQNHQTNRPKEATKKTKH